jgi:hypothetical protein
MILVWGIDPKIIKLRRGHVVLEENVYNFCAHHANEVVDILRPRIVDVKAQEGPDFIEDMGCFITGRILSGKPNQKVFNHQFSYDDYEDLYWFFKTNVLSPKDCLEDNIGYI